MSDTQWPRYFVFKQDTVEDKHQSCGTVHAPDAEMALQIARDVFVRRPSCHSLWVAAASELLTRSGDDWAETAPIEPSTSGETFFLFARPNQRDPHQYQCQIEADSPERALQLFYQQEPELAALGAWAVPESAVHVSQEGDQEAWFRPAEQKDYRHGSFYHPDELLRQLRTKDD